MPKRGLQQENHRFLKGSLKGIVSRIQDKFKSPVGYKTLSICADFEYPDSLYGTVELKQPPYNPETVGEPACLCGCCCCFKSPHSAAVVNAQLKSLNGAAGKHLLDLPCNPIYLICPSDVSVPECRRRLTWW